jgi:hypothetical protein
LRLTTGTDMLCVEGDMSSSFLPVKISMAVMLTWAKAHILLDGKGRTNTSKDTIVGEAMVRTNKITDHEGPLADVDVNYSLQVEKCLLLQRSNPIKQKSQDRRRRPLKLSILISPWRDRACQSSTWTYRRSCKGDP